MNDEQLKSAYDFRDFHIPNYMMGAIERYIDHRIPPGHFLTAVITNNLSDAVAYADDENIRNIPAFVGYFYNVAPSLCWGSRKAMNKWLAGKERDYFDAEGTE